MVIRINDKNQNYNNVTKLLVKPKRILKKLLNCALNSILALIVPDFYFA